MHFIENYGLVTTASGLVAKAFAQLTYVVHTCIGGCVDFQNIGVASRGNLLTR